MVWLKRFVDGTTGAGAGAGGGGGGRGGGAGGCATTLLACTI